MKGSTIFWISVAISCYAYGWVYAHHLDKNEVAYDVITTILIAIGVIYAFADFLGYVWGTVIGPIGVIWKLLPKFNRILDRNIGI